jgi:hypothetical protein
MSGRDSGPVKTFWNGILIAKEKLYFKNHKLKEGSK